MGLGGANNEENVVLELYIVIQLSTLLSQILLDKLGWNIVIEYYNLNGMVDSNWRINYDFIFLSTLLYGKVQSHLYTNGYLPATIDNPLKDVMTIKSYATTFLKLRQMDLNAHSKLYL